VKIRMPIAVLLCSLSLVTCTPAPSEGGREILIRLGTKQFGVGFDPEEVRIANVDKIRIVFRNDVDPTWQMSHSVAIAVPGREQALIASLRHLPGDDHATHAALRGSPDILAMTGSLEPGQSEAIEFHPPGPGTYEYVCLVPGHADRLKMVGRLIVGQPVATR